MDKIIHLSLWLQCDSHQAFELFTDNTHLQTWLVTLAEVEPHVGGRYELFWEPDDRENNSTLGCKITAMELDHFLAFEWRSPEQFKQFANQADPLTHVVVFFIPDHQGTTVHLIQSGWRSTAEWDEARQWQEHAWRSAFEVLGRVVNENQNGL